MALTINTKVPSKWRFVDLETGDIYLWNEESASWQRAMDLIVKPIPDKR